MKKCLVFMFVLMLSMLVTASVELEKKQYKGYIIDQDGAKIPGVIWTKGPIRDQKSIDFIKEEDWDKLTKNKRKFFTEYKPKEIKGYGYNDTQYLTGKYADLSAVGFNMLSKLYFLKALSVGKINAYIFYEGKELKTEETPEALTIYLEDNKSILLQKENGKIKISESVNIPELIADCPEVKERYLNGDYGFKPKDDGEKKGLGKLLSKALDKKKLETCIKGVIDDYNEISNGLTAAEALQPTDEEKASET